jgi:NDP-sugar pyrophosphorylase family protein
LKAIVLCAGYGKRLKPFTHEFQKTMLPLYGKPLLEYLLTGLKFAGFNDFILVVGYRKEQIIDYFQNGQKFDINIKYVEQRILNGTGGALLLCEQLITEQHFFLTWGDILVPPIIYKEVYDLFKKEENDFILVTNYSNDPHKGGAVYCDDIYCTGIIEKPPKGKSQSNLNNCGIFILSKEIFEILRTIEPSKRGEIELPTAISIGISQRNWKVRIFKMEKDQFRGDLGDRKIYEKLKENHSWLEFFKA